MLNTVAYLLDMRQEWHLLPSALSVVAVPLLRIEDIGMARRSSDPIRTREKILAKATAEFAETGFAGARVDRIAERCRMSKNMLYYYFQSKEKLFIVVLERMYEDLRAQQRDISIRASDPLHAMQQLISHTFNAFARNPNAIRLMNEENKHRGKYIRKSRRVRELYSPLVETIRLILDRGRTDGVFRPNLDPALIYVTLSSLCYHYLSNQYTLQIALDRDLGSQIARKEWLEHVTRVVLLSCVSDPLSLTFGKPNAAPSSTERPARRHSINHLLITSEAANTVNVHSLSDSRRKVLENSRDRDNSVSEE